MDLLSNAEVPEKKLLGHNLIEVNLCLFFQTEQFIVNEMLSFGEAGSQTNVASRKQKKDPHSWCLFVMFSS